MKFGLHFQTVYQILHETQCKEKKRGPPIKLCGQTKQKLLSLFRENPTISASKAAKILGLSISERTIRRELEKAAFTCIRVKKTPGLTKKHKEDRLSFAKKAITWNQAEWDRIIFTDEKKWTLKGNDGYVSVWVEGDKKPKFEEITNRLSGFMVWGAISANGGIALICPEGSITAESYSQMLENDFFNVYEEHLPENFIFMHDNAPPHRAQLTTNYLKEKKINVLSWPPLSPDLNPIENLWGYLSQKVYEGGKSYKSSQELWEALVKVWNETPLSFFQNLYNSMSERVLKVLQEKGERIKY